MASGGRVRGLSQRRWGWMGRVHEPVAGSWVRKRVGSGSCGTDGDALFSWRFPFATKAMSMDPAEPSTSIKEGRLRVISTELGDGWKHMDSGSRLECQKPPPLAVDRGYAALRGRGRFECSSWADAAVS